MLVAWAPWRKRREIGMRQTPAGRVTKHDALDPERLDDAPRRGMDAGHCGPRSGWQPPDSRPHSAIKSGGGEHGSECHGPAAQNLPAAELDASLESDHPRRTRAETYFEQAGGGAAKSSTLTPPNPACVDRFQGNSTNVANQIVRRGRDATFRPASYHHPELHCEPRGAENEEGVRPQTRNEPKRLHSGVRHGATL
jgi:hypothetical protein